MNDSNRTYKRPVSVLVVVYSADSQVLLLRRHKPPSFWQSVAGSLEWEEEPRQAAVREVAEETGLDSANLVDCEVTNTFEIYGMWRHRYAPGVVENTEHVFRLQIPNPQPVVLDTREHSEYAWMPRVGAAHQVTSHTNRQAILDWVPSVPGQAFGA